MTFDALELRRHGDWHLACAGGRTTACACIRTRTTIDDVGFDRKRHADRYLKGPEEMHRLLSEHPEALARTREIVARCGPCHLGKHSGGFALTHDRLDNLVPIEPARMDKRQVAEWDKDDKRSALPLTFSVSAQ